MCKFLPTVYNYDFADMILSTFCMDFSTQMIYCIVHGLTDWAYAALSTVVAIDVMGMEKFILGYGVQMLSMGTGMIIGPAVTGKILSPLFRICRPE